MIEYEVRKNAEFSNKNPLAIFYSILQHICQNALAVVKRLCFADVSLLLLSLMPN